MRCTCAMQVNKAQEVRVAVQSRLSFSVIFKDAA